MIPLILFAYWSDAWGYAATKAALVYAQPIICMALRTIISGMLLLSFVYIKFPQQLTLFYRTGWQQRRLFGSIIFFYIYLCYLTYFVGMNFLSPSTVALLYNLSPFVIALLGYYIIDQGMTRLKWLGLVIGFAGVLPLSLGTVQTPELFSTVPGAELLVVISLFAGAYGWYVVLTLMRMGYSPLFINGIGMLGAGLLAVPTSFLIEGSLYERWPLLLDLVHRQPEAWIPGFMSLLGYTLVAVITVDIIYYNAIAFCFEHYSLVFVSMMGMITPILVAPMDWVFFGEKLPNYFGLSFVLLMVGLVIFYQEELNDLIIKKSLKK
jgi:drug/metabolite transporter (DMT)-like permease